MKTEALQALGAATNFIEVLIQLLENNYDARSVAYITSIKEMFKQRSITMTKPLSPKQKFQKLMTEICGGCYMEKITRGLPALRKTK